MNMVKNKSGAKAKKYKYNNINNNNQVLAEQPPDTWDSFPLFQILNDYLRTDGAFFFLGIIGRDILKYIRAIFAHNFFLKTTSELMVRFSSLSIGMI